MKKRIVAVLLVIINLFVLYGCDYKDIDRRAFVVAIGVDSVDTGEVEVNMKISKATSVGKEATQDSKNFIIYKVRSNSVGEAFKQLRIILSSEPDYSHMKLIVISKKYAEKNDITSIIDFCTRRRDY